MPRQEPTLSDRATRALDQLRGYRLEPEERLRQAVWIISEEMPHLDAAEIEKTVIDMLDARERGWSGYDA